MCKSRVSHWRYAGLKPPLLQLCLLALGSMAAVPENTFAQFTPADAQQPVTADFDRTVGMPPYVFRTYQFAADTSGQVRVEVYIGIVNDILQFVRISADSGEEAYHAQYEVNVTIWDKKNNLVDSRNWKRELLANSFDATNDRKKLNLERAVFDLPPGEYDTALEITDRDTGKSLREKRPLKLTPFDGLNSPTESNHQDKTELRFSSIIFTEPRASGEVSNAPATTSAATDALAPWRTLPRSVLRDSLRYNLTAILTNWTPFTTASPNGGAAPPPAASRAAAPGMIAAGAYFEIYGATAGATLQLQYEIRDWRQQVEQAWEETLTVAQTPICYLARLADKINQPGLHTLRLVAKTAQSEATAEESFQVQVSAGQNYTTRLAENKTMRYEPLRYIVKSADYKRIAEAGEARRDSLVAEFWRQRDPDPETPANQLQEEFYRRVAFADMRFAAANSSKSGAKALSGWETDRGRIYIKYGPPKEVHHQMADQGSPPYEVWLYPDLDLYFVFRDKTGSGDFELVNR